MSGQKVKTITKTECKSILTPCPSCGGMGENMMTGEICQLCLGVGFIEKENNISKNT
jgi:DnaJ-class molecular chaperone